MTTDGDLLGASSCHGPVVDGHHSHASCLIQLTVKSAGMLLLLACTITHQSHVQGTVLEPCPRHNVQLNESLDPLRRAVDGTASTSDVFCRLFGTTITTVSSRQSPAQHVCSKSTDPQCVACLVGSRLVGIGPHPVRCLMVWAYIGAVSWWWMPTTQPTLFMSSVSPSLVKGQRTLVGEHGE